MRRITFTLTLATLSLAEPALGQIDVQDFYKHAPGTIRCSVFVDLAEAAESGEEAAHWLVNYGICLEREFSGSFYKEILLSARVYASDMCGGLSDDTKRTMLAPGDTAKTTEDLHALCLDHFVVNRQAALTDSLVAAARAYADSVKAGQADFPIIPRTIYVKGRPRFKTGR